MNSNIQQQRPVVFMGAYKYLKPDQLKIIYDCYYKKNMTLEQVASELYKQWPHLCSIRYISMIVRRFESKLTQHIANAQAAGDEALAHQRQALYDRRFRHRRSTFQQILDEFLDEKLT